MFTTLIHRWGHHRDRPVSSSGQRFNVLLQSSVVGPLDIKHLRRYPGFMLSTPVCLEGESGWKPAYQVVDLKAYFDSTPVRRSGDHVEVNDFPLSASSKKTNHVKKPRYFWKLCLLMIVGMMGWGVLTFNHADLPRALSELNWHRLQSRYSYDVALAAR